MDTGRFDNSTYDNIISSHPECNRSRFIQIMNYIDIFLESLSAERGRSQRTLASYASDLRHADENLPNGLLGATAADVQNYLSKLPERATSIARHASALRG